MTWSLLANLLLALAFLTIISLTIGFYINYRRDQRRRRQPVEFDPCQGRFFRRHIPESLYEKYNLK